MRCKAVLCGSFAFIKAHLEILIYFLLQFLRLINNFIPCMPLGLVILGIFLVICWHYVSPHFYLLE